MVLAASLLSFSGSGILSASYLLLFKRGNPAKWLLIGLWGIAGGMLFPVSILPDWLQVVAKLNPMTHALKRHAGGSASRRWAGGPSSFDRTAAALRRRLVASLHAGFLLDAGAQQIHGHALPLLSSRRGYGFFFFC